MKNYKWLVVFLIFIFIAAAYWLNISNISLIKNYQEGKSSTQKEQKNESVVNAPRLELNGHEFLVELAQEPAVWRQGLSGRASLPSDTGMLFISANKEKRNFVFWMKDMNFPIDLLWIDGDTVVALEKNMAVPSANTSDQDLKTYVAPVVVDKVFEINAGLIDQYGIKVGDKITYYNIQ